MKILVNGTPLLAPLTGIGQYIRHLFTAMEKLPQADIKMYYGTSCKQGMSLPSAAATQAAQRGYGLVRRFLPRPRAIKKLVEQATFRYHTRGRTSGMLYHEPNCVPLPYKGPTVITVCDLSCFDHPEAHPLERVQLMQRDMPRAIENAEHIIVISQASGDALRRWFDVDPTRITTTYLAADERFKPRGPEALAPFMRNLGLAAGAYVLSVGTLEPRKNLTTLFAAYAGLPANLRQRYPLVVAGMKGWGTDGLMKSAQALVNRGELRLLGYLADELIPHLYAGAAAFCYPSRYEGFGLPALEAMASGVPVITSNRTSLPEVVGDAGIMLDPDDVDGLREQLRRLLEDRAHAQHLASLGLVRAQSFSWDRCAQETFAVYEKVMAQRGYNS
ncbi:glycosyltransferase family 4 protein [Rhodoferax antarcticus]|uniref:glycosyltransferase family 4 protein n=1 Tax=Rhodoferax antarcticus TaxID=81479 RepID=UPI002224147F|nr:glycosyltransferase family 1 protein [Rhodoferax antarcticus]MCW2313979.1 alpha-1,3-rhamnosyl/mannosyltransferase [Rhodoferax antarcticus]